MLQTLPHAGSYVFAQPKHKMRLERFSHELTLVFNRHLQVPFCLLLTFAQFAMQNGFTLSATIESCEGKLAREIAYNVIRGVTSQTCILQTLRPDSNLLLGCRIRSSDQLLFGSRKKVLQLNSPSPVLFEHQRFLSLERKIAAIRAVEIKSLQKNQNSKG